MKRRDIMVGEEYLVRFPLFLGTTVSCRVLNKSLFGFRIGCVWLERLDHGYPTYKVYGHKWSWQFLEPSDDY